MRVRGRRPRLAGAQQDWVPGEASELRLGLGDGTFRLWLGAGRRRMV